MIFVVYFASTSIAADLKTVDGKEYKDVTVRRVEPDGVVLVTKWGISKVYFSELPENVQEHFGYHAAEGRAPLVTEQQTNLGLPREQTADHQHVAAIQRMRQGGAFASVESPDDHTYEITRDYVIGGDTGEVAVRLKRGERYRGRILADGAELHINGISYTVISDILSSPRD